MTKAEELAGIVYAVIIGNTVAAPSSPTLNEIWQKQLENELYYHCYQFFEPIIRAAVNNDVQSERLGWAVWWDAENQTNMIDESRDGLFADLETIILQKKPTPRMRNT